MEANFGILTLIPPLVAIVLCFKTKQVLPSLFIGLLIAALIIAGGNPLAAVALSLQTMVDNITDEWNAKLLLFTLFMGVGITFIWRLGGSFALTGAAKKHIKTRRGVCLGTWGLGMATSLNDCLVAAVDGNVFRDVCKDYRISSEKFSYVLDSTAAPSAAIFISDWIAYQIGMIGQGLAATGVAVSAVSVYVRSIPYNLYPILSLIFVGILMYTGRDYGPMLLAETRALLTGKFTADGSQPMLDVESELGEPLKDNPKILTFVLPIVTAIIVILFGLYWTGREGSGIMGILEQSDASTALLWGSFAMTVVGLIMALGSKKMNFNEAMQCYIEGFKLMILTASILVMAWSLSGIVQSMGLSAYVVSLIGTSFPFWLLIVIIFLLSMLVSFATGTSWGTMAIMTPLSIQLAYALTGDASVIPIVSGLVFSGAIFGDHCSPISDTTVMASIYSGADHIAHVRTQLPYALTVAVVVIILHTINAFTRVGPLVMIPVGVVVLYILQGVLHKFSLRKYDLHENYSRFMKRSVEELAGESPEKLV